MRVKDIVRFAGTALVAAAVLVGTSACVGLSATAGSSGSTASGAAASASTSEAPPSAPVVSTASSAAGQSAEPPGAAACTSSAIRVTIKSAGAAMNHEGYVLIFTNHGGSACILEGYPGVAVVKGSTTLLNATRSPVGYLSSDPGSSVLPITVAPGKSASAMVEWAGNAGETCYPHETGTLDVTPPNTRSTSSFVTLTLGDIGICADFEVHPVVSGVLPYVGG